VLGEISSKQHATPSVPTDATPNENVVGTNRSSEYQTAYAQGQREAQENIAQGKPSIYTVGKPGGEAIDEQTGFPLVAIAGCIVDDSIIGRRDGYNDRIRQWAAARKAVEPSQSTLDSQQNSPQQSRELSSGITGRSTSTTMPGTIPIGVNQIKQIISPLRVPIAVFDRIGRKVSSIQPDAEGYFRITLKPGTYRLKPLLPESTSVVKRQQQSDREQVVTVKPEQFTSVWFNYTTFAP
jgi:hypothetical protein